jgi:hypothetical protein
MSSASCDPITVESTMFTTCGISFSQCDGSDKAEKYFVVGKAHNGDFASELYAGTSKGWSSCSAKHRVNATVCGTLQPSFLILYASHGVSEQLW